VLLLLFGAAAEEKNSVCSAHTSKKLFSEKHSARGKCKFQASILNLRSKNFEFKTPQTKVGALKDEFILKDKQKFVECISFFSFLLASSFFLVLHSI
jgi:hypothetical protein